MLRRKASTSSAAVLPGTLDLLVLQAASHGEQHGYGILLRVAAMTDGALVVEQGAIYPALARLERQGLIDATWGTSENNRRAKFYRLNAAGRQRLKAETRGWDHLVAVMNTALGRRPV